MSRQHPKKTEDKNNKGAKEFKGFKEFKDSIIFLIDMKDTPSLIRKMLPHTNPT